MKTNLKAKLDKVFSLYIRARDSAPYQGKYFKCISCGKILPISQADCGHYINRRHMATRFSEINCHAQCRSCNRFDEGNIMEYRKTLVQIYGEEQVLLLEASKNNLNPISDTEYKLSIKYYQQQIKKLQL